jgi:hypothetical protein
MRITIQGVEQEVSSLDELCSLLGEFDRHNGSEAWLSTPARERICMLRNGQSAWLMYQSNEEDAGYNTIGDESRTDTVSFELSNGQIDEYPGAWCIPAEDGYRALLHFYRNAGSRPEWLRWEKS